MVSKSSIGRKVSLRPGKGWLRRNFITEIYLPSLFVRRRGIALRPQFPVLSADQVCVTWIGHASFLVTWRGLNILIDPIWSLWLKVIKRIRHPGVRLDHLPDIDLVLVTHAHFDHIGGLAFFKNAKVLLSENEYKKVKLGMLGGYLPDTKNLLKNVEIIKFKKDSVLANSFQESFELFKGLKIVPSYGHTAGHISVLLNKEKEYLLFTGDNEFDGTTCRNKVIQNFQSTNNVKCLGNHNEMLLTLLKPE